MKIITSHGIESSTQLAKALNEAGVDCEVIDVRNDDVYVDRTETVFSYGSSVSSGRVRKRYNKPEAVKVCVDKVKTFEAFKQASIPSCEYTQSHKVAEQWGDECIVRQSSRNRRNEGMEFWNGEGKLPRGQLYTRYFYHSKEFRVTVFLDSVAIYYKKPDGKGNWILEFVDPSKWRSHHEDIGWYAVEAAKAIGIDYVGFDVLLNDKKECCFLEANSCPILTDEIQDAIIEHFVNNK